MPRNILDSIPIVGGFIKLELEHQLNRHREEIDSWALGIAFEAMGLPDLAEENATYTRESFTKALNAGPLKPYGIELTKVFDRVATRQDLEKIALQMAAQEFGIKIKGLNLDALRQALQEYVKGEVRKQLGTEAGGDLINGAAELRLLAHIIDEMKKAGPNGEPAQYPMAKKPLKMDAKSIANRERQARYRANHSRHWEPRDGRA